MLVMPQTKAFTSAYQGSIGRVFLQPVKAVLTISPQQWVCLLALDLSLLALKCGSTGKEKLSLGIFVALNTCSVTVQSSIKECIGESNIPLLEKG